MKASPIIAVIKTLLHEDATLSGKVTQDRGGPTRWGIAEHDNPDLKPVEHLPLEAAIRRYLTKYFLPAFQEIENARIMDFAFDLSVNLGPFGASKVLQEALIAIAAMPATIDGRSTVDGHIGSKTLEAINGADPDRLIKAIAEQAREYYEAIVRADPMQAKYLAGWKNRIESNLQG